jgi:hypothetical protein
MTESMVSAAAFAEHDLQCCDMIYWVPPVRDWSSESKGYRCAILGKWINAYMVPPVREGSSERAHLRELI